MDASKMNRRVRIEALDPESRDAYGQVVPTYVPQFETWAQVLAPNGKEVIKSDAPVAEVRVSIRVRFRPGIQPGMRASLLRFENGAALVDCQYDIDAVQRDMANRDYMDLVCKEVTNVRK
jgi:SPP1 family predicted phage head-tail adaptor